MTNNKTAKRAAHCERMANNPALTAEARERFRVEASRLRDAAGVATDCECCGERDAVTDVDGKFVCKPCADDAVCPASSTAEFGRFARLDFKGYLHFQCGTCSHEWKRQM